MCSIDPVTGVVTNIGPGMPAPFTAYNLQYSVNPVTGAYTFEGAFNGDSIRLFTLDPLSGAIVSSPLYNNNVSGIDYSPTGQLLGIGSSVAGGARGLCSIDPVTGVVTNIGPGMPAPFTAYNLQYSVNPVTGAYTFEGAFNGDSIRLFTLDPLSGAIVSSPLYNNNVSGIDYSPYVVPEPSSVVLLIGSATVFALSRSGRRHLLLFAGDI